MNYVNLHSHTSKSLLDGHGGVEAYMERAAELSMPALATTDHGNLFSWLDFYEAGQKVGIKSILGCEYYMARNNRFSRAPEEIAGRAKSEADQKGPYHITLLAQNDRGYKNLIKLSSLSYLEGFYQRPRIDLDLLAEYSEGVICGSGCLNGIINQALLLGDYDKALQAASNLKDIFGKDNLFIEVMNHGIEEELQVLPDLVKIAKELDLRVVATQDSHYVRKEDSFGHDLLLCVSTGATVDQEDRFSFEPEEFYLKSYEEMLERFEPEWLSSSLDIAESVELELEFGKQFFPEFELPEGRETNEYFEEKAWEGIRLRYGDNPSDEVVERANYELRVIKEMGFPSYFLVVADLMRFAREAGIRSGPGRGSSAASIVSYAMQITHLDPLWFNLPFERFLVPPTFEYAPSFTRKA